MANLRKYKYTRVLQNEKFNDIKPTLNLIRKDNTCVYFPNDIIWDKGMFIDEFEISDEHINEISKILKKKHFILLKRDTNRYNLNYMVDKENNVVLIDKYYPYDTGGKLEIRLKTERIFKIAHSNASSNNGIILKFSNNS